MLRLRIDASRHPGDIVYYVDIRNRALYEHEW